MKIFSSVFCFLILFPFFACNKNSDTVTVTSKTDLISSSAWNYENAGIDNDKNGTIDVPLSTVAPSLVQSCKTDNTLTFKKDNTGITDEGATKCNSTDPQTSPFNWSFADNEININISNSIFSLVNGKSKIVALTSSTLSLSRDTVLGGTTYSMVVSLRH